MDPFPSWAESLWDAWIIRAMILWSLTFQVILILLGGRRKYIKSIWIDGIVWAAYLVAEWIATVCLGKLSEVATQGNSNNSKQSNNALMALWAPLLLLHLGGPDTITALQLEDVQLWLRLLVGLVVQALLAFYVILRFWPGGANNGLLFLTIPMFVSGIIKYGERAWAIWSTNSKFPEPFLPIRYDDEKNVPESGVIPGLEQLILSYVWLKREGSNVFKQVMATFALQQPFRRMLESIGDKERIFEFVETILGLMYDSLYTKANIIYTRAGCIVRSISFICMVSVLLGFSIITRKANVDEYSTVDIGITYLLLIGAILVEVYAVTLMVYSDLGMLWMAKHYKNPLMRRILRVLPLNNFANRKRWSRSVARLDLVSVLHFEDKPTVLHRILKHFNLDYIFKKYRCQRYDHNLKDVKDLIIFKLTMLWANGEDMLPALSKKKRIDFGQRGEKTLERHHCDACFTEITVKRGLDESIMKWQTSLPKSCKLISDYMVYLLANRAYMLGITTTTSTFKGYYDRLKEIEGLCGQHKESICDELVKREKLERHAHILMGQYGHKKWDIIGEVWVEMFCHGAARCEVNQHLQQLRRGGEFATHVRLLQLMWLDCSVFIDHHLPQDEEYSLEFY